MGILKTVLYLLLTLLGLSVQVFVHELGHYLAARACHVTVYEFSIGFGKSLYGFKSKKTGILYSIRMIPLGGYVSMGEDNTETPNEDLNLFTKKNVWQKIFILAAGASMNILIGFLCMTIMTGGMFMEGKKMASTTIGSFADGATSQISGLAVDDTVLKVNGVSVHTGDELAYEIMNSGYQPVDILVERDGKKVLIQGVVFPSYEEQGISFGDMDFRVYAMENTIGNVFKSAFWKSVSSIKMVFDSLGGLITGRYGVSSVSGPIGISSTVQQVASQPMAGWTILYLFALISMNLGIMNLLPLPALDGGRLFFRFLEVICFGHAVNPKIEAKIHSVGIYLFFLLAIVVACKDIVMMIL